VQNISSNDWRRDRRNEDRCRTPFGISTQPLSFILVLDVITEEIEEEAPWAMLFADDLVLCDESSDRIEERLENWRGCLEDAGLKVSRAKTEHLPPLGSTTKIRMKKYDEEIQM